MLRKSVWKKQAFGFIVALVLSLVCLPVFAYAEPDQQADADIEIVSIGKAEDVHPMMPVCSGDKYSLTQQIYNASLIGKSGTIKTIAFHVAETDPDFILTNLKIYLYTTRMNSFSGSRPSDAFTDNEMELVYEGVPSPAFGHTEGWHTITLDTPYSYNMAAGNLAVAVSASTTEEREVGVLKFTRTMYRGDTGYSTDDPIVSINRWHNERETAADISLLKDPEDLEGSHGGWEYVGRIFLADMQLGFDTSTQPAE